MYTMLAGVPPFDGETELEIVNNVKTGIYDLQTENLEHVSDDAKGLISQMLKYEPHERLSAQQVQNHYWFKLFDQDEVSREEL